MEFHGQTDASLCCNSSWSSVAVSGLLYRCPHQLDGHKLTISVVDDTDGIFIVSSSSEAVSCAIELRDLTPDITEEILRMFFQNRNRSGGDEIEEIFYRSEERRAIITFTHPEGCTSPSFGI